MEKMLVSGVAADKNTARISLIGLSDKPGVAFLIFDALAKKGINVDMILQSIGRDGTKDISFTVPGTEAALARETLESNLEMFTAQKIDCEENVAKVSVVGAGMATNPGVAAKMFEALYNANINIRMISTSEIRITVLIDENETDRAVQVVHEIFELASGK